jgi:hypothetical protein
MKTTLDLVDVVYNELKSGPLKSAINGGVYKYTRPLNSSLEDVVINSLPVTNQQLQQAIVNVNVFVPNADISLGGSQQKMADHVRLKALGALAVDELKDGISGDYTWDVQQQTVIQDDESDSYYINIRLQFYVSNIN